VDTLNAIKNTGLKATQPRLKVLQAFQKSGQRLMTAEDVFRLLLAERFDIGLATVYRVLTQFEQARILKRNHFEAGKATYELADQSHHDHLVCLACGKVEEFFDAAIERRQRAIALERGWTLQDHAMALYGRCAACRRTS
jgi:Fur family ferric uptake transcriptional regulator